MNYWAEKRGINNNLCRVTLRNLEGHEISKNEFILTRRGAFVIKVKDLFSHVLLKYFYEGSVEFEVISGKNLFINYPAAVVRYLGHHWHTNAHSSQRYYSQTSGDDKSKIDFPYIAEEGNGTIHREKELEPFFIIHNGKNGMVDNHMMLTIVSESGRTCEVKLDPQSWKPCETRIYKLSDIVDHRSFLGDGIGTYTIKYSSFGGFPRIIAGNEHRDKHYWSIDHTNFAALSGQAANDTFKPNNTDGFNDLAFNLPNHSSDDWNCFVDLYPT